VARLVLFELVPRPVDGYLFVCYAVGMRAAGPALVISSGEREALEVLARPSTAKHREVQPSRGPEPSISQETVEEWSG
jgi:hypothetical protein